MNVRAQEARPPRRPGTGALLGYLVLGTVFGLVLAKGEAVSWWRIQEMFRFQGFHMYGVLGCAWVVGLLSLRLLKGRGRSLCGDPMDVAPKERTPHLTRYWAGGTVFGLGWALLGACPGPLYVLVGYGLTAYAVAWFAALLGAFAYGLVRDRLPH
jgi:uncharacterized membrane protein YedE/YeeE